MPVCATERRRAGPMDWHMDDEQVRAWAMRTLERLGTSKFRAKFSLAPKDRAYALDKGEATIREHARDLLAKRVGTAWPENDGRQTPWKGHPVFTAQHATATCCRGCIEKWHRIPKDRPLTEDELNDLTELVIRWIRQDLVRQRRRDEARAAKGRVEGVRVGETQTAEARAGEAQVAETQTANQEKIARLISAAGIKERPRLRNRSDKKRHDA